MEKSNTKGDGVFMKKIIMPVILAMTVVGCELFSPTEWSEYNKRRDERGVECYRQYGNVHCEDKEGNRY